MLDKFYNMQHTFWTEFIIFFKKNTFFFLPYGVSVLVQDTNQPNLDLGTRSLWEKNN